MANASAAAEPQDSQCALKLELSSASWKGADKLGSFALSLRWVRTAHKSVNYTSTFAMYDAHTIITFSQRHVKRCENHGHRAPQQYTLRCTASWLRGFGPSIARAAPNLVVRPVLIMSATARSVSKGSAASRPATRVAPSNFRTVDAIVDIWADDVVVDAVKRVFVLDRVHVNLWMLGQVI